MDPMRCEACDEPLPDDGLCRGCASSVGGDAGARADWLRAAARRSLHLARVYRAEEGPGGRRERECVEAMRACRAKARDLRARGGAPLVTAGLAKAGERDASPASRAG
jgi:hypothetical protein